MYGARIGRQHEVHEEYAEIDEKGMAGSYI